MANSNQDKRELRAQYMECRRKCKKLHKGLARLRREIDGASRLAEAGDVAADSFLLQLLDLSKTGATTMQRLQIEAWLARQSCERHGVTVPAPHRSEGEGFSDADPEALVELRDRLETEETANSQALIREGRV